MISNYNRESECTDLFTTWDVSLAMDVDDETGENPLTSMTSEQIDGCMAEFHDLFKAVFDRNAKWSTKQPVPEFPKAEKGMKLPMVPALLTHWRDWCSQCEQSSGSDT